MWRHWLASFTRYSGARYCLRPGWRDVTGRKIYPIKWFVKGERP
nr:MAG TPA: hypothetical protein [Caudoviricetes sp.]